MSTESNATEVTSAERKRKRLESWRRKLQEEKVAATIQDISTKPEPGVRKPKVSLRLSRGLGTKSKKKTPFEVFRSCFLSSNVEENHVNTRIVDVDSLVKENIVKRPSGCVTRDDDTSPDEGNKRKRNRWDISNILQSSDSEKIETSQLNRKEFDTLDKFMDTLTTSASKYTTGQDLSLQSHINIDVNDSELTSISPNFHKNPNFVTMKPGVITMEDLTRFKEMEKIEIDTKEVRNSTASNAALLDGFYNLESKISRNQSTNKNGIDDDKEEKARRTLIEAIKNTSTLQRVENPHNAAIATTHSELKSEKQRREERLKNLQNEAMEAARASATQPDIGRIYNDMDGGVMEEAERTLDILNAAPDALEVLAELNKKKELKAVDHGAMEYFPIRKNIYIVPRSLVNLSNDDIMERRAMLKVRVRGQGVPAPISTFAECGLSERILAVLDRQVITDPYPIQAQCLPCIMGGRDVIGIAKTGSGKTLAYLLPMLRHISDQPGLAPHESGPIGLVLAPARELAVQIHHVTQMFAKHLGLKSTAVYGGAGVAEQIADLKRGTHIAVATPGRMIDILTMQSGKILSLKRVSFVVCDEADRMFDMGFAPQISAILSTVRPDRQTLLFSATFPKTIEVLAKKSLSYPIEVIVGGRSLASDSVVQFGEVVEEEEKFLRLLQLLGDNVDDNKKVIIFVDTQNKADSVFEQLIRCGYLSLSLHGGKEQEDRDSTISDFKRIDGPSVLVATSVAGRGLDVTSCACVINYAAPNHLEDYVHRIGRTGRAGNKGVAYTFVNSGDEVKYAPLVVRAMIEAGQSGNISSELRKLSDEFKEKVKRGEARFAGSGFKGKGYSYDSSEMSDSQKLARLEKRRALIDAGMLDPDDGDCTTGPGHSEGQNNENSHTSIEEELKSQNTLESFGNTAAVHLQANLSADILALPGMKEAIMKKAGIDVTSSELEPSNNSLSTGSNHFVEEIEINDYPREARWKVTQKETTSRLQDEFQTAVTLKGQFFDSKRQPEQGERKLHLHLEATSERVLKTCIQEIRRLLNEETLRVGTRALSGSHRYNVLG